MVAVSGISRIARAASKLIFMDEAFSTVAEKAIKESVGATTWRNIPKQNWRKAPSSVWNALKKAEAETCHEPFWSNLWNKTIKGFPGDVIKAFQGKKGLWGTTKAFGGALLKRLPLLFVALEIPNIYSAYKDKGVVGGTVELAKSATKFAAGMAGFVAGQALIPIPFVGGLIGCFATDWVVGKILGKSHTEKKEEAEAKQKEALAQQQELYNQMPGQMGENPYAQNSGVGTVPQLNTPKMTISPQQLMAMQSALYGTGAAGTMDQDFMEMTSGIGNMGKGFNMMA